LLPFLTECNAVDYTTSFISLFIFCLNYEESINYLYKKLPLYSRTGAKAFKADLKNTLELCQFLDHPEKKILTIHVAGTNGKGSVSHMLAAILQENGYKTGLYTSPHLKDFRERIKINGTPIDTEFVIDFVEKTIGITEEIKPSFFELTFAMALDYFAASKVDVAVIETGLGGRLDSTNVITPLLSVITNIGYDHMDMLGNTLPLIAAEKAGIIKPNVPVVIGEATEEIKPVFDIKARECVAPVYYAQQLYKVLTASTGLQLLETDIYDNQTHEQRHYTSDLNALYQQKNLVTVLAAISLLKTKFSLSNEKINRALASVKKLTGLHGRWEIIHEQPLVILDVAHNEDGIRQMIQQIQQMKFNHLHLVFGMVKDKETAKVIAQLPRNASYYFCQAAIPRALPATDLQQLASEWQLNGSTYANVNDALKSALQNAQEQDLVIVCGSVFVVGEVDAPTVFVGK
jgi:dihydrofolate synthase / folylpolyglutamate synthase